MPALPSTQNSSLPSWLLPFLLGCLLLRMNEVFLRNAPTDCIVHPCTGSLTMQTMPCFSAFSFDTHQLLNKYSVISGFHGLYEDSIRVQKKRPRTHPALKEGNNNGYHNYVVRCVRISHLIKGLPNFKFLQAKVIKPY